MKFKPQSEDEINASQFLPDGEYDFTVLHAEEKISAAGNEYIFLKLQVWDREGKEHIVFTNLALMKLLKHFCDVAGLQDKYKFGEILASDCVGKVGLAEIGFEPRKPKPDGSGYFSDKNVVKDYVSKKANSNQPERKAVVNMIDDDLPF